MVKTAKARRRRPKVQGAVKVKVFTDNGKSWIEERCWRCRRVLNRHYRICVNACTKRVQCPTCKAINIVEEEI